LHTQLRNAEWLGDFRLPIQNYCGNPHSVEARPAARMIWSSGQAAPGTDRSNPSSCASSVASCPSDADDRIMLRQKGNLKNEIARFCSPRNPAISIPPVSQKLTHPQWLGLEIVHGWLIRI
jgi:hypothetical protein